MTRPTDESKRGRNRPGEDPSRPPAPKVEPDPEDESAAGGEAAGFLIVGIGASAGGLEAFKSFFQAMPADSGMAFVLVPHLDPRHESLMVDVLKRSTRMPVSQVDQDTAVEAVSHLPE